MFAGEIWTTAVLSKSHRSSKLSLERRSMCSMFCWVCLLELDRPQKLRNPSTVRNSKLGAFSQLRIQNKWLTPWANLSNGIHMVWSFSYWRLIMLSLDKNSSFLDENGLVSSPLCELLLAVEAKSPYLSATMTPSKLTFIVSFASSSLVCLFNFLFILFSNATLN